MLTTRLNLLESHLTGLPLNHENLLDKYRKMSNIDKKLLDEIYYLGNYDLLEMVEKIIRSEKIFL